MIMGKGQQNRHLPAFLLLFLATGESYGGLLLSRLEAEMLHADSAAVYRSLQELEAEGAIESSWEVGSGGPPRKWYRITEAGLKSLHAWHDDILLRRRNLDFFLDTYGALFGAAAESPDLDRNRR
jgi:PadR family transcriptional regulator PadR